MQSKILSKRVLLLTVVISGPVFSIALILFLYFFPKSSVQGGSVLIIENTVVLSKQEQASVGLPASPVGRPAHLKIPSINVDAPVEYVGITSDGAMDAPNAPMWRGSISDRVQEKLAVPLLPDIMAGKTGRIGF